MVNLPSTPYPDNPHPDIERVRVYWEERCPAPDRLPHLSDIQLMDLYDIADHLLLADVIRDDDKGLRYFWRYGGTALRDFFGAELTGKFIHEAYSDDAAKAVQGAYNWIVETGRRHYWIRRGGLMQPDQRHLVYERYICPVIGDSGGIDHLFGIIVYPERPASVAGFTGQESSGLIEVGVDFNTSDPNEE